MLLDPPPDDENDDARDLVYAVATAALTALVTGLVSWGVDELRARYGSKDSNPKGGDDARPR